MAELNVSTSYDGASGDSLGGYFATHWQDPSNATRSTARTAYYNPFVSRPSLVLLTSCQVTRVITESTHYGPKVTGVEVIIIFPPAWRHIDSIANLVTDQFAKSSTAPRVTARTQLLPPVLFIQHRRTGAFGKVQYLHGSQRSWGRAQPPRSPICFCSHCPSFPRQLRTQTNAESPQMTGSLCQDRT